MARTPAIPMANPFEGSFETEADILQYLAVIPGTDDHQVTAMTTGSSGDGTVISGIAQFDALDGEWVAVRYFGPSWAYADGAITRDNAVEAIYSATAANNGRMKAISGVYTAGKMIAGIALEDAADGEKFKVFLTRHIQVALS